MGAAAMVATTATTGAARSGIRTRRGVTAIAVVRRRAIGTVPVVRAVAVVGSRRPVAGIALWCTGPGACPRRPIRGIVARRAHRAGRTIGAAEALRSAAGIGRIALRTPRAARVARTSGVICRGTGTDAGLRRRRRPTGRKLRLAARADPSRSIGGHRTSDRGGRSTSCRHSRGVHGASRRMRGRRCRCAPSHDAAILHTGGRGSDVALHVCRAERTRTSRRGVDSVGDLSVSQGSRGQMLSTAIDPFAVHKSIV